MLNKIVSGVCAWQSDSEEEKKRADTNHNVSLYLYYIIKFNVVPETNHTGWTDDTARPQHTVPAKREKRQRKAQRVSKLRKETQNMKIVLIWGGVHTDKHMSKEKTGWQNENRGKL